MTAPHKQFPEGHPAYGSPAVWRREWLETYPCAAQATISWTRELGFAVVLSEFYCDEPYQIGGRYETYLEAKAAADKAVAGLPSYEERWAAFVKECQAPIELMDPAAFEEWRKGLMDWAYARRDEIAAVEKAGGPKAIPMPGRPPKKNAEQEEWFAWQRELKQWTIEHNAMVRLGGHGRAQPEPPADQPPPRKRMARRVPWKQAPAFANRFISKERSGE